MIRKIKPDKQKAKSLFKMALTTLERLKETDKLNYPSNTLTDYYDILRKFMEALPSLDGIKIQGEGAHVEIINYVCEKYGLSEQDNKFVQELRDYRNRISYEGFSIRKEYIERNATKIERLINKLNDIIKKNIK